MTTLAMYVASMALLAGSPADTADSVLDEAQAAPVRGDEDMALPDDGARTDTARTERRNVQGRRTTARGDGAPERGADVRGADPAFNEAGDAARFQQGTWTGP